MKRIAWLLICWLPACSGGAGEPEDTSEVVGHATSHFLFLHTSPDRSTIDSIGRYLEGEYERIRTDLGSPTLPTISIHLHANRTSLLSALNMPNAPSWVIGSVTGPSEVHLLSPNSAELPESQSFASMLSVMVHEFAHAVTLNVNPASGNNPRWLWEGVAIYESGQFVHPNRLPSLVSGNPPTLAQLEANWQTNTQVYDVGYLLAEYIVTNWGKHKLVDLIRASGNIQMVLGVSVSDFESGWYAFVRAKYL
jgi:hypothetical protein